MLKTILSFFTSSSGWLKGLALAIGLLVSSVAGYTLAANHYKAEIARLYADYSKTAQTVAEANLKEARRSAEKLSDAIAARDAALRDLAASRSGADGLREQLASYERKLSAAGAGACESERKRLAGCVSLLREGADLAAEGARLAVRTSADKDALARLLR